MITKIAEPGTNQSLQDDLWHILASDNSGQTGFRYVFDVYVNGDNKATIKQFPEPGTARGYFNAGPIVRNSVTYEWFTPLHTVYCVEPTLTGEIGLTYQVQYGEDYSGITTFNMASGETLAYNWRPPLFKRRVEDLSSMVDKFLTNRPHTANNRLHNLAVEPIRGDSIFVGLYKTGALNMQVKTYGANNQLIQTFNDSSGYTATDGFVQLNLSSAAINNRLGTLAINDQVKYYTVYFGQDLFTVNITCDLRFTPVPLHFMNAWGMFDTATFGLVSRLNMEVERKGFSQRDHSFGASSVDYKDINNRYRESRINYGQRSGHMMKLTMNYPTDAEYEWLAELIMSPQIYAQIDNYYYPVTIKDSNYEYSKQEFNRMKVLEIEIEINQPRYSHAR